MMIKGCDGGPDLLVQRKQKNCAVRAHHPQSLSLIQRGTQRYNLKLYRVLIKNL